MRKIVFCYPCNAWEVAIKCFLYSNIFGKFKYVLFIIISSEHLKNKKKHTCWGHIGIHFGGHKGQESVEN